MMSSRPELGDIRPGDEVYLRRSNNDMRRRDRSELYIRATVATVARVWITIEAEGRYKPYRMRRDSQDEGTQYSGSNWSFVTPEQRRWDDRRHEGRTYLDEQGIKLSIGSPWEGREAELAEAVRSIAS
jgi:hypothetical protein